MVADNFSKEMRKHRAYFNKHNVYKLIYADDALVDCAKIFQEDIVSLLSLGKEGTKLSFMIMEEYF